MKQNLESYTTIDVEISCTIKEKASHDNVIFSGFKSNY